MNEDIHLVTMAEKIQPALLVTAPPPPKKGQEKKASPPISTGYVSPAFRLRHASRAGTLHFSQCVNHRKVRCSAYLLHPSSGSPETFITDMQDSYIWQMHDAAVQVNLARSRQEVKHQNNKQHPDKISK